MLLNALPAPEPEPVPVPVLLPFPSMGDWEMVVVTVVAGVVELETPWRACEESEEEEKEGKEPEKERFVRPGMYLDFEAFEALEGLLREEGVSTLAD